MPSIAWLDPVDLRFPPLEHATQEPNGLLAAGGDLRLERLLEAYRRGIFPWYEEGQPILWWSPDPRSVLFPTRLKVNRSLTKALKRAPYHCTTDRTFSEVIDQCAAVSARRPGTWITDDMRQAYLSLHKAGRAHSVEVWLGEDLIGGLYGVAMGKVFFGESMFSLAPNGSKIALCALCEWLMARDFAVIDCQVGNPYLTSMGAEEIPRRNFQAILNESAQDDATPPSPWDWHWHSVNRGA
ncbi:leucyl/phenylalanyl-tRNA--protein transferase [Spongiibacter taiwanensis]|uniref:leucyl/phenylalanyl-tRNA--protein transferase n=1 Tax=Spongiibacter taiwanensis TaxID=1748242 RepID=UPI002036587E|nr:leucyl/phenylalanyl-tRNA--protein transferase [Spongiibacter taiwanensis]USA43446.1 leucyl/phenylalanyl-tRNA--protein transferase [Spongiibacter taiwanensis]